MAGEPIGTTNLWYARLCKSAARATGGALLGGWSDHDRRALVGGLVQLPPELTVVPLRQLAWSMGELTSEHDGLSTLGAEAVAAAQHLSARLVVSARDDGPGIRRCCDALGVPYTALAR